MLNKTVVSLLLIIGFISSSKAQLTSSIADSIMASSNNIPYISAGIMYLPDGNGNDYTSTITHTVFGLGDTIQSASDISTVCMNIEHSYIGDLDFKLECPNGSRVLLSTKILGEGSTFLGEAQIDGIGSGTGWNYCFSEAATWGTMDNENVNLNHDTSMITPGENILSSGLFSVDEPFDSLIGCPLNGDWKIIITDNLMQDNGYIFNWQVNFDTLVFPAGYNLGGATVLASGGVPPYSYFWSNGATTASVNRLAPGTYTVQITDSDTINKKASLPNKTFSTVVITEGLIANVKIDLDEPFSIYPNPVLENLNISFKSDKGMKHVTIHNLSGVLLTEKNFENKESIQLDLENYPKGIYFVKVQSENETFTKKIIKQ
jgi:subtilisin-like proprotein convertase family protein